MGRLKERIIKVVYLVVDKASNEALNLYENRIDADNRAEFLSDKSINHICVVWKIELIPSKQKIEDPELKWDKFTDNNGWTN